MGITTLDLSVRLAAKKNLTKVQQKLASKRKEISEKREAMKNELKSAAPAQ